MVERSRVSVFGTGGLGSNTTLSDNLFLTINDIREERNKSRGLRGCLPVCEASLSLQNKRLLTVSRQREVDLKGRYLFNNI